MNATELREALATLGLSQRAAANRLDISPRLMRYFCAGDPRYPIPRVVELALERLLEDAAPVPA